jgi:MFS family permease
MATHKQPILTRPMRVFLMAMILANIGGEMHRPLLPLYLQSLGADVGKIGLFFTLSALVPLALQIFGGWLSDSIGRLQAIALGSVLGVFSYLVMLVAPTWQWLLLATAAGAMCTSFVAPSYQAFIAEQSTEQTRGRVYGIVEGLFAVVGVVGPPIGGYLAQRFNFRLMFAVAAALYVAATVIRLLMARDAHQAEAEANTQREKPTLRGLRTNLLAMAGLIAAGGIVTWIMISDGVRDIAFGMSGQLEPLYMQNVAGLSTIEIGWLASIASLTTMLLMTPAGWLSDKKGERVGIVAGFLVVAAGLLVFVSSRVFAGFVLAWLMFGVGDALIRPAYSALISKAIPDKLRGTAFGLFSTSIGFISLPAPFIGALLWERYGAAVPFYVPVAALLVLLPVMWIKFKLPSTPPAVAERLTPAEVPTPSA